MKTTFITREEVWQRLTTLARNAKRAYVASAYLGRGSRRLLPLRPGSCLVVDMSDAAVSAGSTDPSEVDAFQKRKVKVYSRPNLHAKVYVFDRTLIVGSPNISRNSKNQLLEAAIVTRDRDAVAAARGLILSLLRSEITPAEIRNAIKRFQKRGRPKKGRQTTRPDLAEPRLWMVRTYDRDFPPEDKKERNLGLRRARMRLTDPRTHCIEPIWWTVGSRITRELRRMDLMICIEDGRVYRPCIIADYRKYRLKGRPKRLWVYLEVPKKDGWKSMPLGAFRRRVKSLIPTVSERAEREIRSPRAKDFVLDLLN